MCSKTDLTNYENARQFLHPGRWGGGGGDSHVKGERGGDVCQKT